MKRLALPLLALSAFTACADLDPTDTGNAPIGDAPVGDAPEALGNASRGGAAPPTLVGDTRPRAPRAFARDAAGAPQGAPHGGSHASGPDGGASRSFVGTDGTCGHQVQNQGDGRVLAAPRLHRVFLGDFWSQSANTAEASSYDSTWSKLGQTPAFWNRLREYGVGLGSAGTRWNVSGTVTGSLSESTIQAKLQAALSSASYTPSANDVFVVFLPSGASSATDFAGHVWDGHHDHFTWTVGSTSYDVVYAVIEYVGNADYRNPVVSHETSEASTDPDLNAFYGNDSNEIGDYCRFTYNHIAGVNVETIYSQRACACVSERDLNALDADGDGLPNLTVFRPSQGLWFPLGGSTTWQFGDATMTPLPGDYDGDGRTELALFKDGTWDILYPTQGVYYPYHFGASGEIPVPADYDGDGKTDLAFWVPSTGTWWVWYSSTGSYITQQWGTQGDIPVPGDYDGDGKADFAVRRPSTSSWYVIPSSNPSGSFGVSWGVPSDTPVAADMNGDGQVDWVLFRPSEGRFYVSYKDSGTAFWVGWGQQGDIPVVRDYDGDFKADLAVWRPSDGNWYVNGVGTTQWGTQGDVPVQRNTLP